jgi:peptide-methionine (R)-S-oxide reductase
MSEDLPRTEEGWRARLEPRQYEVLRRSATEAPFTGVYWDTKDAGTYRCAGCGAELFRSEAKYDSGSGWPSFFAAMDVERVMTRPDHSLGRVRTEVICARCGGHLGHVFDDGPDPTGLRYCINSAALDLDMDDGSTEG